MVAQGGAGRGMRLLSGMISSLVDRRSRARGAGGRSFFGGWLPSPPVVGIRAGFLRVLPLFQLGVSGRQRLRQLRADRRYGGMPHDAQTRPQMTITGKTKWYNTMLRTDIGFLLRPGDRPGIAMPRAGYRPTRPGTAGLSACRIRWALLTPWYR